MRLMRNAAVALALAVIAPVAVAGKSDIRQAGGATFGGVPSSIVAGIQQNPPKHPVDYTPQQFTYDARPGAMINSVASRQFMNRIVTPFAHPIVKGTAPIKVQTAGPVVFLTMDPSQDEPVVVYLMDKGDDLDSIALMLQPKDVGPVQIELNQNGRGAASALGPKFNDAKAAQWEQSAPYTQSITDLMRAIAQRKVPPGYAFRDYRPGDRMPTCQQAGLSVTPKQVLEGHDRIAFVGVLTNTTRRPIEFQEQTCAVSGVLAVASWPGPLLQPHQSSEVYVVVRRSSLPSMDGVRPSALTSGDSQ